MNKTLDNIFCLSSEMSANSQKLVREKKVPSAPNRSKSSNNKSRPSNRPHSQADIRRRRHNRSMSQLVQSATPYINKCQSEEDDPRDSFWKSVSHRDVSSGEVVDLESLPKNQAQGTAAACAHPSRSAKLVGTSSMGRKLLVDQLCFQQPSKIAGKFHLAEFIEKVAFSKEKSAEKVILTISENPHLHLDKFEAVTALNRHAFSTIRDYWRIIRTIRKYMTERFHDDILNYSFFGLVASDMFEKRFCAFLLWKAKNGHVVIGTLRKCRTVVNYLRPIVGSPKWPDQSLSSHIIKCAGRILCAAPNPTEAIPYLILRELTYFLQENNTHEWLIMALAFNCASRASEIIKLKLSDISFENKAYHRNKVRVKFFGTKTKSRHKGDFHLVTFYERKAYRHSCPYRILTELVKLAKKEGRKYLGCWGEKNFSSRSYHFYKWFRNIKRTFRPWLKAKKGWDFDTSKWRFHSIRTTYVGLMHMWGMSWDQIRARTGHKFDAQSTRETYCFNALITADFDKSFDEVLSNNVEARSLFGVESAEDVPSDRRAEVLHEEKYSEDYFVSSSHPSVNRIEKAARSSISHKDFLKTVNAPKTPRESPLKKKGKKDPRRGRKLSRKVTTGTRSRRGSAVPEKLPLPSLPVRPRKRRSKKPSVVVPKEQDYAFPEWASLQSPKDYPLKGDKRPTNGGSCVKRPSTKSSVMKEQVPKRIPRRKRKRKRFQRVSRGRTARILEEKRQLCNNDLAILNRNQRDTKATPKRLLRYGSPGTVPLSFPSPPSHGKGKCRGLPKRVCRKPGVLSVHKSRAKPDSEMTEAIPDRHKVRCRVKHMTALTKKGIPADLELSFGDIQWSSNNTSKTQRRKFQRNTSKGSSIDNSKSSLPKPFLSPNHRIRRKRTLTGADRMEHPSEKTSLTTSEETSISKPSLLCDSDSSEPDIFIKTSDNVKTVLSQLPSQYHSNPDFSQECMDSAPLWEDEPHEIYGFDPEDKSDSDSEYLPSNVSSDTD